MTALSIQPTFPIFTDIDGQPLESGYIWIGTTNLNPITNPITVYWDAALTLAAVQPIRTIGGYPVNAGTPARLYVNSDYSIQVQNRNGSVVYSASTATERYSGVVVNITAADVAFTQAGAGAVPRTVQGKLEDFASVKDFGASPAASAAANAIAFNAALATGKTVFVPNGEYAVDPITIINGSNIVGESKSGAILRPQGSNSFITWNWDTNGNVVLRNFFLSNITIKMDDLGFVPCIYFIGAQYCTIQNVLFRDTTGASQGLPIHLEFSYFCLLDRIHCRETRTGIRFYGANFSRGPNHNVIRDFNGENFRHYGIRLDNARGNLLQTIDLEYSGNNLYYGTILDNSSYNIISQFWYEANYATTADPAIYITGTTASDCKKNSVIWSAQIIHPQVAISCVTTLDTVLDNLRFVGGTSNINDSGNTNLTIINPQSESPSVGFIAGGSPSTKIIDYDTEFYFTEYAAANIILNSLIDGFNGILIQNAGVTKFSVGTKPATNEVSLVSGDGEVLRIQDVTGFLVPVKGAFQFVNNITAASAQQNCLFVDSADGILKFKDGASVVHNLY
jgi:hypothetical protein